MATLFTGMGYKFSNIETLWLDTKDPPLKLDFSSCDYFPDEFALKNLHLGNFILGRQSSKMFLSALKNVEVLSLRNVHMIV